VDWTVEYTDEFDTWWKGLDADEQDKINTCVILLEQLGPNLDYPHTSSISGSRHSRMRELRIQISGRPVRVLYCFDPRRAAVLLIGGDKTRDNRWYEKNVPIADRLYDERLKSPER
jgi:hypothetical protein